DDTVMRDMAISQDHTVTAYLRRPAIAGPAVDRNEFANGGIVADLHRGLFSGEFKILRVSRYDGPRKNTAVLADPCPLHDRHIAADPGPSPNLHILMDHRKRVYSNIRRQPRIGVNRGIRVDKAMIN